jgi:2,3-bisphosphoglycerate-dependent phosphoglycerate mutase
MNLTTSGDGADTVVVLVRHAHAQWTPDERRPLSERGRIDAERLAAGLVHCPVEAVYASSATRAQETVAPIAATLDLPVKVVDDLRERKLSGEPVDDWLAAVRATWDDASFVWPGGESNQAAQCRGVRAVEAIVAAHPGQYVVIGTHGNLLALILQQYDRSIDFAFWRALSMPDAYRLRYGSNGIQYEKFVWADKPIG